MSKVKASDLAKELGMTWKQLAQFTEENLAISIKSPSTKLDEEQVQLIKDMIGVPQEEEPQEEQKQVEEKKETIRFYDLYHKLGASFEEAKEALKLLGYDAEKVDNFTEFDPSIEPKLREKIEEVRKIKEEERKKEEEKLKRRKRTTKSKRRKT